MPSTVNQVLQAAGLTPAGVVRWRNRIRETGPGVYVVSLGDDPSSSTPNMSPCPVSPVAVDELLAVQPELTVDGRRPDSTVLSERLAAFWLGDESIVYIGLAGTSLKARVGQYYKTELGARRPHAGGWFLKTLSVLDDLFVHFALVTDVDAAERAMLAAFAAGISATSRDALRDKARLMPFANLEAPKGTRKAHGIKGAREPLH